MKTYLLKHVIMLTKYSIYGMLFQVFTFTLLFASESSGQMYSSVKETSVNLKLSNADLEEVFNAISKQTNFEFQYDSKIAETDQKFSIKGKGLLVSDCLLKLSRQANLHFKQVNNSISVSEKLDYKRQVEEIEVIIQTRTVTGTVTAEDAPQGLPGVNVILKGSSTGTVTDINGNYSIDVPSESNSILVFSSVGYVQEEVAVGNQSVINIAMVPDITSLEEIVVVGYGTQKKVNVTGAVSSIDLDNVEGRPITDLSQALAGLASGVQVTQSGGRPGADGATIRIRGVGTLNNSNPLVLIDGIQGSMAQLDPNDIKSISILKDAASAAIYGSRAANGVILITTKKGSAGDLKIKYHGYYGWQSPTRLMDFVSDHATYMELRNEAMINSGGGPINEQSFIDEWREASNDQSQSLFYPNTDWFDYAFENPTNVTGHNLSVNGGSNKAVYNLSLGYLDQEGLLDYNSKDRYNLRLNTELNVSEKIKVGTNLYGFWEEVDGDYDVMNIFLEAANSPGVVPVHPDGRYGGSSDGTFANNPYALYGNRDDKTIRQGFLGVVYTEIDLLKDLTFKSNGGLNFKNRMGKNLTEPYELWDFRNDEVVRSSSPLTNLSQNNNYSRALTLFNTLNYSKNLEEHGIELLMGQSTETYFSENFNGRVKDLFSAATPVLSSGIVEPQVGGGIQEWSLVSFFGRLNYDFDDKYLFEANLRYDGSSRFKEGNRWGAFPSFSAGWRISEESFFPEAGLVDAVKLRFSWGKLGNQLATSLYPYQTVYNPNETYNFDGEIVAGIAETALKNEDIKWETTTTTNVGFDIGLFESKFNLTFDYFNKLTEDILIQLPIPDFLGNKSAPTRNIGTVRNSGVELTTQYQGSLGEVYFNINGNLSYIENKVEEYLGGEGRRFDDFIIREGLSLYTIYGFEAEGIFNSQQEVDEAAFQTSSTSPGDLKYSNIDNTEVNGQQVISVDEDSKPLGGTIPKFIYGLNFNMTYNGFDLGVLFEGVGEVSRYLEGRGIRPFAVGGERGLLPAKWLNSWTPENTNTDVPRIQADGGHWNYRTSSYWVQNAGYLRLKMLQLGYTLPSTVTKQINLNRLRIYANAQNILTVTDYEGFDPETNQRERNIGYPLPKTYTLGIQLTF